MKLGAFLAVERAQALVVDAGLFQLDMAANHLDHVATGQQILNKTGGNHAKRSTVEADSRPPTKRRVNADPAKQSGQPWLPRSGR